MTKRRDQRSEEALAYRYLYKTSRWAFIREEQLLAEPWCEMCKADSVLCPATVCDHIIEHKGDPVLFHAGPFQSLCAPHHDMAKQKAERAGYSAVAGPDGWPLDPAHPANFGELKRNQQRIQRRRG